MRISLEPVRPTSMKIVNSDQLPETIRNSPKGRFFCGNRLISEALGRQRLSTDLHERHPFDVTIARVAPGRANYPYHAHSAQWEFYHVLSGRGKVRHAEGFTEISPGDAFLFKPGEAHQLINDGTEDLVFYVVADNPHGESCHYPDSGKWLVQVPERRILRSENLEYFDGEE